MTRRALALILVALAFSLSPTSASAQFRFRWPWSTPKPPPVFKPPYKFEIGKPYTPANIRPGNLGGGLGGVPSPLPGPSGWTQAPRRPLIVNPGVAVPLPPAPRLIVVKVPMLPLPGKPVNDAAKHTADLPPSPVEVLLGRTRSALNSPELGPARKVEVLFILHQLEEAKKVAPALRDALDEIHKALQSGRLPDRDKVLQWLRAVHTEAPDLAGGLHAALGKKFRDLKLNTDSIVFAAAAPQSGKQLDLALLPTPEAPAGTTVGQRGGSVLKGLTALPEEQRVAAQKAVDRSEAAGRWKMEYRYTLADSQVHLARLNNELMWRRPADASMPPLATSEQRKEPERPNSATRPQKGKAALVARALNRKLRLSERLIVAEMNDAAPEAIAAVLVNLDREEGR